MNNLLLKIKKLFSKLKGLFPTSLPVGMTEFDDWSNRIIQTYDFPDNDSVRFTLATMILHSNETDDVKPDKYFAKKVKKGMANQVAAGMIQELKAKHEAKAKAEHDAATQN